MKHVVDDTVTCRWCGEQTNIGSTIGQNTNQCPRCGNPVFVASFGDVETGARFVCDNGRGFAVRAGR
jgi:ribosomal protein S27AE